MANEPKSRKKITDERLDELLGGEDPKEGFLNGGRFDPKLIYLALRNVAQKWKQPPQFWSQARSELAIRFGERFIMVHYDGCHESRDEALISEAGLTQSF